MTLTVEGARWLTQPKEQDWLLGVVALLLATVSAALMVWENRPDERVPQPAPSIARIEFSSAVIRRRPPRTLVWDDVVTGEPLRGGDTLFVPSGVEATLRFTSGALLELDENSLIVLDRFSPGIPSRVELRKGSLLGRTAGSGLEVASGEAIARVIGSGQIRVGRAHSSSVEVLAGQARVTIAAKEHVLNERDRASFNEGGQLLRRAPYSATLLAPDRNARFFFTGAPPPVNLAWRPPEVDGASLQVARDRSFAFVVATAPATAGGHVFSVTQRGVFWWRLVDTTGEPLSEARRFTLMEDIPPLPLSPRGGELVWLTADRPIPFAWTALPGVPSYRLEVSASPTFAPPLFFLSAAGTSLRVSRELPEGTYYWRVRADDPGRSGAVHSRASAFRIIHKPVPEAPELLPPEIEVDL